MKIKLLTFLFALVFNVSFSQLSSDSYNWLILGKITKERIGEAKLMFDVIPNFPKRYYGNLMDYISVDISTICEGKTLSAESSNEVLSAEQKRILNAADFGTDINIKIKFSYKDPANDVYGTGGRIKEITPLAIRVVPEIEAEYPGGFFQLTEYLRESVVKQTSDTGAVKKILNTIMNFSIDEEGKVIGAKIVRSSTDVKIDELLIEALNNMPKWNAAQNAKGEKVKQVFNFPFRRTGC